MNNIINQIKVSKLFNNISMNDIEKILYSINYRVINLLKNEHVFHGITSSNYIGIILHGNVNIERILPSGKSVFMYSKGEGDIFGEVAVFSKTEYYPCNVVSQTKTSLIIFHKLEFLKILMLNSHILDNFLKLICNKTFYLNNRVTELSLTSAKEKIVYSLLNDFNIDDNLSIKLPFNKQCWANTLNVSRASLYRELNILCQDLIISFTKSNIIKILNIKKLEEIFYTL